MSLGFISIYVYTWCGYTLLYYILFANMLKSCERRQNSTQISCHVVGLKAHYKTMHKFEIFIARFGSVSGSGRRAGIEHSKLCSLNFFCLTHICSYSRIFIYTYIYTECVRLLFWLPARQFTCQTFTFILSLWTFICVPIVNYVNTYEWGNYDK